MFDSNTSIHMVGFILFLDQDRDEDPGFCLINLGCVGLLSIRDCKCDPFYQDGCFDDMDPCIYRCLLRFVLSSILASKMLGILYYVLFASILTMVL